MAAGSTYTPIATTTLGSSQTSVTFNSFSGYTDLELVINGKLVSGADNISLRFNSDSGSNYSETAISGNGSAASSFRDSNLTYGLVGTMYTTDSVHRIKIMNYSNTTTNKTTLSRSDTAGSVTQAWVMLWRSTSAITSFSVQLGAGGSLSFATGSTFTLYGIAAA